MKLEVSTQNLILCLSEAIDLINSELSNHHKFVACIAYQLCDELGIPQSDKKDIIYASAIHDIGALSISERLNLLDLNYEEENGHSKKGYLFLKEYEVLSNIAELIRLHHAKWNNNTGFDYESNKIIIGANIIFLADRIAVLIDKKENILAQKEKICTAVKSMANGHFADELVDAFLNIAKKEAFWLNIVTFTLSEIFENNNLKDECSENIDNNQLIRIFSRIIDFRSRFTSTHSSGVAAAAKALSQMAGFSEEDTRLMEIAGFVHDIGKLAVPSEILEKKGSLTKDEYNVILSHTYYTNFILSRIKSFDKIREWASQHHEKLDGTGYPFHLDALTLSAGSRIMAVADVFVALFEDRPYRKGMQKENALAIINSMTSTALDPVIVELLSENFTYINDCRIAAQASAEQEYALFSEI